MFDVSYITREFRLALAAVVAAKAPREDDPKDDQAKLPPADPAVKTCEPVPAEEVESYSVLALRGVEGR